MAEEVEGPIGIAADEVESRLLGRPASMGRREISRGAESSLVSARRFWHALGFQIVEDEAMFTEADLEALQAVSRLVRDFDVDEDLALGMTRALARTADRLAVWQTQLVAESFMAPEEEAGLGEKDARAVTDVGVARQAAGRLVDLADELEPLMSYVWRRHLASAITRMLADADDSHEPSAPPRVVGFADLVNFTSLVRRMTERQLANLVQRFELLASDVVTTHGGRVIKTVGDEVLFVHTRPAAAAAIALDLVDAMQEDELMPPVRVGMAHGSVVSRLGDVFGVTVNRASRLTSVTPSGRVFVDDELARRLGSVSGFRLTPGRRRSLRGIGLVTPFELHRSVGARRIDPSGHPV
ncbi:MAG TPA: adenylate/guanylate cyclase domain-containing protein [Phycicoccus sp.]|nr:adenylate/guanylate cyclase domain-containing protein [Phycicoccus sp.]HQY97028.1 adenylate/guanylate cyclase domain-containing protein [Phycicoccus sp.]HRA44474.1 adenylate/guanylate cyclase domain-containing protein [Phycicoccus sp.]